MCQYIEDATIQGYELAMKHVASEMERLGFGDEDVLIGGVVGTAQRSPHSVVICRVS